MKCKISIIIPIYNVEEYLEECLESLINQTLKDIEVIMVDDRSSDLSGEIADTYAERYENFIIIHKDNGGVSSARNIGLRYVNGKYIMFLDPDDYLAKNACELLWNEAEKYKADIVFGKIVHVVDGIIQNIKYLEKWFNLERGINHKLNEKLAIGVPLVTSKLFRTNLIMDNGIASAEEIRSGADVVFAVETFNKAKSFYIIPDTIYYYRIESGNVKNLSLSHQHTIRKIYDRINVIKRIDDYCDKYNLPFIRDECRKATFGYIYRTINNMKEEHDKKKAYEILKNFVDEHFEDKNVISNGGMLTYEQLQSKCRCPVQSNMSIVYDKYKIIESKKINREPKISIIIPVYNVENYLRETLDSIIYQTIGLENLEVIMIDDGSNDNSGIIMEQYCERYCNFKAIYLGRSNGAPGKPRNEGIEHARGKYIMFLDSDDLFTNNACEILYNKIEETKNNIVIGKYVLFNSRKIEELEIFKYEFSEPMENIDISKNTNFLTLPPAIWSKIYRTSYIKENNFKFREELRRGEDAVFIAELLLKSKYITYIPEIICKYRKREKNDNNLSLTQDIGLRFFEEYAKSRKILSEVYKKSNIVNYYNVAYVKDVYYIVERLLEIKDFEENEQIEIFRALKDFMKHSNNYCKYFNNYNCKMLVPLIANELYSQAIYFIKYVDKENNYKKTINDIKNKYSKVLNKVKEMEGSNSWRITEPLRTIGRKIRNR